MKRRLLLTFLFLMVLLPVHAYSWSWTPLQLAIWEPVQLFPENYNVYGARMNLLYGSNHNLVGLDIGGVNVVTDKQTGGQVGLINISEKSLGGCVGLMNYTNKLQGMHFGLFNTSQDSLSGLQAGIFLNLTDFVRGFQIHGCILGNGAVRVDGAQLVSLIGYNLTDDLNGLQMAMLGFNYTAENARGVQFAMLYNYAKNLNGLQIGLVNACESLSGVQIGLVNVIRKDEKMFIMPLLNFRF